MTTPARMTPAGRPAIPSKLRHFRSDVQGLRAVAVGLVLLNHVFGWPGGGYVGVDVFFVISGFLITGLLVRERERSGRISFRGFYVRRARRILPAAVAVLVVTSVVSRLLFLGGRAHQILGDSVWSLVFAANINFAQRGTDYFASGGAPSPVQHFWSLSVEEQFYLAWPALILAVSAVVVGARRRFALGAAMLAVCGVSFWWSIHATAASPAAAYFSTFTRAWELGVGALVAVAAAALRQLPAALRAAAAWAGLGGIALTAFAYSPATAFPGSAAAFPVLAAAAVVAFGDAPGGPGTVWALGSLPMRFLGDISYSLYLWHWPVVVIVGSLMGAPTLTVSVAAVVVSLLLATASYFMLEQPVLASGWLLRDKPDRRDPHRRAVLRRGKVTGLITATACAAVAVCVTVLTPSGGPAPTAAAGIYADFPAESGAADADPLTAEIRASLSATKWGPLTPALDDLKSAKVPEWRTDRCLDVGQSNMSSCLYGDPGAPHRAVLLGDSVAISWMPGLRDALQPAGWSIQSMTWHQCPNITAEVLDTSGGPLTSCTSHRTWALRQIAANPPGLVILSNSYKDELADRSADVASEWRNGLQDVIERLRAAGSRVVVLAAPPRSTPLEVCATAVSTPTDCVAPVADQYETLARAEQEAAASAGATFVDTRNWFCVQSRCPAVIGTTPVYVDDKHLTAEYSHRLAPQLQQTVLGAQ